MFGKHKDLNTYAGLTTVSVMHNSRKVSGIGTYMGIPGLDDAALYSLVLHVNFKLLSLYPQKYASSREPFIDVLHLLIPKEIHKPYQPMRNRECHRCS